MRSALVLPVLLSCASCVGGAVYGEIDGEAVPRIASAAWGTYALGGDDFALGLATAADACQTGAENAVLSRAALRAIGDEDDAEDVAEDTERFLEQRYPLGGWSATVSAHARSLLDFDGSLFQVGSRVSDDISLTLCRQDDLPRARDASVDSGATCFSAHGPATVDATGEELVVQSDGELRFERRDNSDAGLASVDLRFAACPLMTENLADYADAIDDLADDLAEKQEKPRDGGDDSCTYAFDGECDEPTYCARGTDSSDCR